MGSKNKKTKKGSEAELDSRFSEIKSDPRYLEMPKKNKKVVVDDRFKQMFAKKGDFNTISKYDKTGKLIKKQDRSMHKFYDLGKENDDKKVEKSDSAASENAENSDSEASGVKENKNKFYDENGDFAWNNEEDESSSSGDDSEEDEESEEENEQIWDADADIPFGETTTDEGIGKRLALNKMDWDHISAVDLMALFNSLTSGDVVVYKVEIYPSLFGLEKMKHDSLMGPPQEIFAKDDGTLQAKLDEKKKKQKQKKKDKRAKEKAEEGGDQKESSSSDDEASEVDEQKTEAYNQMQLRKYELEKMKYYYAIIHCNSKKSAVTLYDEYQGFEFEDTNIQLNISFVPDDIVFEQKVKEVCSEVPDEYEFSFNKINRATGHSDVKLTWDQPDSKRQKKLAAGFMMGDDVDPEKEAEYWKDLINTDSDDDDEKDKAPKNLEEQRKKLLEGLESSDDEDKNKKKEKKEQIDVDNMDWDAINSDELDSEDLDRMESAQKIKQSQKTPDIKFESGFGEDIGEKLLKDKKDKSKEAKMTQFEKYEAKKREKKMEKKEIGRIKREKAKEQRNMTEAEIQQIEDNRQKLSLLVGDAVDEDDEMNIKVSGAADSRFGNIIKENRDFALDPTHKDFDKKAGKANQSKSWSNKKQKRK